MKINERFLGNLGLLVLILAGIIVFWPSGAEEAEKEKKTVVIGERRNARVAEDRGGDDRQEAARLTDDELWEEIRERVDLVMRMRHDQESVNELTYQLRAFGRREGEEGLTKLNEYLQSLGRMEGEKYFWLKGMALRMEWAIYSGWSEISSTEALRKFENEMYGPNAYQLGLLGAHEDPQFQSMHASLLYRDYANKGGAKAFGLRKRGAEDGPSSAFDALLIARFLPSDDLLGARGVRISELVSAAKWDGDLLNEREVGFPSGGTTTSDRERKIEAFDWRQLGRLYPRRALQAAREEAMDSEQKSYLLMGAYRSGEELAEIMPLLSESQQGRFLDAEMSSYLMAANFSWPVVGNPQWKASTRPEQREVLRANVRQWGSNQQIRDLEKYFSKEDELREGFE